MGNLASGTSMVPLKPSGTRQGVLDCLAKVVLEMRSRYECLLNLEFERILNGHNPKPIDQHPKDALQKVLRAGTYELHPSGFCTYLWLDLFKEREGLS